jgi:hypothetical protein
VLLPRQREHLPHVPLLERAHPSARARFGGVSASFGIEQRDHDVCVAALSSVVQRCLALAVCGVSASLYGKLGELTAVWVESSLESRTEKLEPFVHF